MSPRLEFEKQKLDALFKDVSKLQEDEIKSHLAKYLCIQASGYLENVIKELIAQYHENTCKKQTANFVNNKIKRFSSINDATLQEFLNSFDTAWVENYRTSISEEQIESLNSIISQRNLIAHGSGSRSNLSFRNMVKYYEDLKKIADVLSVIIKK